MKQLSYWQSHPEIREFAASIDAEGRSRLQVIEAIKERFGEDVAPTNPEMITKLRMGEAAGIWKTRQEVNTPPRGWSDHGRTFWDAHPGMTRYAAQYMDQDDCNVQRIIQIRFGAKRLPTINQIQMLREGLETGRFTIKEAAAPKRKEPATLSAATLRLFSNEQATECLIPGVRIWTRLHCVKRQAHFRIERNEKAWDTWCITASSRRVLVPELALCVKCANWIPASDLRIIRRKLQRGFILEASK